MKTAQKLISSDIPEYLASLQEIMVNDFKKSDDQSIMKLPNLFTQARVLGKNIGILFLSYILPSETD